MAAIVPVAGHSLGISYTPSGGGATTLKVENWSYTEKNGNIVVTHTGTAGLAARIAGITDLEFTFTASVDTSLYPWATTTPLLRAGAKGTISFTVNSTGPDVMAFTVILEEVTLDSRVDGNLKYTVRGHLDNLAEAATLTTYAT